MKKTVLSAGLFMSVLFVGAQNWQQLPDFTGSGRDDGAVFTIGQKAWCGTGMRTGWLLSIDFYVFDMASETWSNSMWMAAGEERQYACGFSNDSLGFIFGGIDAFGNYGNDLKSYDPVNISWISRTSLPAAGRSGASCFVLDSLAFIVGGQMASTPASDEVWMYNMNSDTWQQRAPLPFGGSWRASAATCNDTGYLIFGKDSAGIFSNRLLRYNFQSDSWTVIGTFPGNGRTYAAMQAINNKLVVFAGVDSLQQVSADLWTYDPVTTQWQQQPSLPAAARKGGISFTNGTDFYYTTGIDQLNNRLDETWKLADATGTAELQKDDPVLLFPNPADAFVQIRFPETAQHLQEIILTDISGRIIRKTIPATGSVILETTNLLPGIYFLRIVWDEKTVVKPFVVSH